MWVTVVAVVVAVGKLVADVAVVTESNKKRSHS